MDGVDDDVLRSLAAQRGDPALTSLYVEVDGRTRPRPATYRTAAASLLRAGTRAAAALSPDAAAAVEADAERITRWLADDLDRAEVRGVAFFACSRRGLFEVVTLPVPVRDQVTVDVAADVRQLLEVRARAVPTLVVLTDHERAKLLMALAGSSVDDDCLIDLWPRHVDAEPTIGDLEHRHAEADRRHLRRVADAVDVEIDRHHPTQVVLGGPTEAVGELGSLLSPHARALVIGTVDEWPTAPPAEILPAVDELRERARLRRESEIVRDLPGAVAEGRAATGLAGAFDAVAARRAGTLLVRRGLAVPGHRCPTCDRLWTAGERCGACGTPTQPLPDVVPILVAEAVAHGADVVLVEELGDGLEDVAVLESFRVHGPAGT